jgi:hypothetical protein
LDNNSPKQLAIKQALRSEMQTVARAQGINWEYWLPYVRRKEKR